MGAARDGRPRQWHSQRASLLTCDHQEAVETCDNLLPGGIRGRETATTRAIVVPSASENAARRLLVITQSGYHPRRAEATRRGRLREKFAGMPYAKYFLDGEPE